MVNAMTMNVSQSSLQGRSGVFPDLETPGFGWKREEPFWKPAKPSALCFKPTMQYQYQAVLKKLSGPFFRFLPSRERREKVGSTDTCMLYRLPAELLHHVSAYLSVAERRALRLAIYGLSSTARFSGTKDDWKEFHGLLKRGRFLTACRVERAGNVHSSHLMCSGCMTSHERTLFSPSQRLAAGEHRVCIGREGRAFLCEHISFTFDEMQQRKEDTQSFFRGVLCCDSSHYDGDVFAVRAFTCGRLILSGEVIFTREYRIMQVSAGSRIEHCQVVAAMSRACAQMCPHLSVDSPSYFHGSPEYMDVVPHHCRSRLAREYYHFHGRQCSPDYYCPNRHCDTCFFFTRVVSRINSNEEDLYLTVRRSVGQLLSPVDPRWLAQLSASWKSDRSLQVISGAIQAIA